MMRGAKRHEKLGPMLECVGGPLDGRDMPVLEPKNAEDVYPDIYYEGGGLFYQKVSNDAGDDVCYWYAGFQTPDPALKNRWWGFYAYRGVHAEDAELGDILDTQPVALPKIPTEDRAAFND